jgi:hypothetical protein
VLTATLGTGALVALGAPPAYASAPTTFSYTGAAQTYTIPTGATKLQVVIKGASGGGDTGGPGGTVTAVITTPSNLGTKIQVMVGGSGALLSGGFNGGGSSVGYGGGGATDLRQGACAATSTCTLADRTVIAGGGGGGSTYDGGSGGATATPGFDMSVAGSGYGTQGAAATSSGGGSGGAGYAAGAAGTAGTLGTGGTGGAEGDKSTAASVTAIGPPGAPTAVQSQVSADVAMTVSWTDPATTAAPVGHVEVQVSAGSGPFTAVAAGTCSSGTPTNPCTVTGLTGGGSYRFQVVAVNDAGTSSPGGPSAPLVAVAAPGAPTPGAVTVSGPAEVTVAWTAPGGAVSGYKVYASVAAGPYVLVTTGTCAAAPTASPCKVTGLALGQTYTFKRSRRCAPASRARSPSRRAGSSRSASRCRRSCPCSPSAATAPSPSPGPRCPAP